MADTLVLVDNVSKRFCRDLKRSLWYGVTDIAGELLGRKNGNGDTLRKDEFWAVKDVSFELKRGECLGLIGHNGAGKSTLLKMLNGLIKPDNGTIEMRGRIGALIELGAGFNPVLTGLENIYINGSILGLTKNDIDSKLDAIIEFSEVDEFLSTPVQYYSSGMKVRLGFAIAAQMEPDVLIIDEVLAVGDAAFRVKCYNKIFELLDKTAVIFVSHNMTQISRISSGVLMLDHGKRCYYGNDIAVGMAEYFKKQNIESTHTFQGNGQATITEIVMTDEQRNPVAEVSYGQCVQFLINYTIDDAIGSYSFLIVIRNEEHIPVAQIKSPEFKNAKRSQGELRCIETAISRIQFCPGKYTITISISQGKSSDLLCVYRDYLSFAVFGNEIGYAPILLEQTWTDRMCGT